MYPSLPYSNLSARLCTRWTALSPSTLALSHTGMHAYAGIFGYNRTFSSAYEECNETLYNIPKTLDTYFNNMRYMVTKVQSIIQHNTKKFYVFVLFFWVSYKEFLN